MHITVYSIFTTVFFSSVLILAVYFFRKHPVIVRSFGVSAMLLLYLFCAVRMAFPLEIPQARIIHLGRLLNPVAKGIRRELFSSGITVGTVLAASWLSVSVLLFLVFLFKYMRYCKQASSLCGKSDSKLQAVLSRVKRDVGKDLCVTVQYGGLLDTAVGFGMMKKRILLPERSYGEKELYYVIRHEYTHFLNHDLAVIMMVHVFSCVFWWNPAVYLLQKDMEQILEIKCDLSVIGEMKTEQKIEYMRVLLNQAEILRDRSVRPVTGTAALLRSRSNTLLEERFLAIQRSESKKKSALLPKTTVLLLALCLFAASYLINFQAELEPPKQEVVSNGNAFEIEEDEITVCMDDDGNYTALINGEEYPISREIAELYKKQGSNIQKEATK